MHAIEWGRFRDAEQDRLIAGCTLGGFRQCRAEFRGRLRNPFERIAIGRVFQSHDAIASSLERAASAWSSIEFEGSDVPSRMAKKL